MERISDHSVTAVHKFPYDWTLKDAAFTKDKGKVFSCFSGGGGSTMGYKLAGFDVIGCCEIDPRVIDVYKTNHKPRYAYSESVSTLVERDDLPPELYQLDILDGSPPCSVFSMNGKRSKGWGVSKKFREGQAEQRLDTLFFDFIKLADKLQPKIIVAENVKGLMLGAAQQYFAAIISAFERIGYNPMALELNAGDYGVPQSRERVVICATRSDCPSRLPPLRFKREPRIPFGEVKDEQGRRLKSGSKAAFLWSHRTPSDRDLGNVARRILGRCTQFSAKFLYDNKPANTITTGASEFLHYARPIYMSKGEIIRCSTFPSDYDFGTQRPEYTCGMSVPPVLMAHIATAIAEQWLPLMK